MDKYKKMFLSTLGSAFGSLFNILIFGISIYFIFTYAGRAYDFGKKFASTDQKGTVSKEISVSIPDGSSPLQIAEILEKNGLVNNKYYFFLQARFNGTYNLFKSGTYALNTNMSAGEIMDILQRAKFSNAKDEVKVTIPEGLTLKQMAAIFEKNGLFKADDFLSACKNDKFNFEFLTPINKRDNYLEGYLFPDTYNFSKKSTPDDVIRRMLARFDEVYDSSMRQKTADMGLTMDKVVVMASIIEREIKIPGERELASAVIENRLKKNMPLQMCSTIMYALDKNKDRLLDADLEVKSPYNTYKNPGLPIGPIAAPGKASILAALNPAGSAYLYFVLKDEKTGEHFFTNNYDEFLKAKAQYNQKF